MKKIGIVTITELDNFGNRLQNYALQSKLQELGFEVETIKNLISYGYRNTSWWRIKQLLKVLLLGKRALNELKRKIAFEKYDEQYFRFSQAYSTINYITEDLSNMYDYFVCGSDQIWNTSFLFNLDFNFLTFASPEKRIAYSPSFGYSKLPDNMTDEAKADLKNKLQQFKSISVREYAGSEIVKELTGLDVPTLIDPTMLYDASFWDKMRKKPFILKEDNYILKYFLGNSEKADKSIAEYAKANNCTVIDLYDNKSDFFAIDPAEFLWLIKNAHAVFTDSFHGTVFCILYNTPFVNVKREGNELSMNSRIETLFKKIDVPAVNRIDDIFSIRAYNISEYEHIDNILRKERAKSTEYLCNALDILTDLK